MEHIDSFKKLVTLNMFLNTVYEKKKSHAYLLVSEDELTASIAATILALHFSCENKVDGMPCYKCGNCLKVINGTGVDIFVYPKKNNIVVEEINEIVSTAQVRPLELKNKIYMLNNFSGATISAQNKLLKTLEEPPHNVIFILTATSEKTVLPTIASRVTTILLKKSTNEEIESVLKEVTADSKRISIAMENSAGNLGKALSLVKDEVYFQVYDFCLDLVTKMDSSKKIINYSSVMEKNRKFILNYLDVLTSLFRDMLMLKENVEAVVNNKTSLNLLKMASITYSKMALIKILEEIESSKKMLKFNVNVMGIIDTLLLHILEVKHKWKN